MADRTSFTVERLARMLTRMLPFDRIRTELRHQRNAKEWSLDQLAEASGVDRATIHMLENVRKYPTIKATEFETVRKLIEAMGLSLTDFFAELEGLPDLFNQQGKKDLSLSVVKPDNAVDVADLQAVVDRLLKAKFAESAFEIIVEAITKHGSDLSAELQQLRAVVSALLNRVVTSDEQAPKAGGHKAGGGSRGR